MRGLTGRQANGRYILSKAQNCPTVGVHLRWPYQCAVESDTFEYFPESAVVANLRSRCDGKAHINVFVNTKTLEYDLALHNSGSKLLVSPQCPKSEELRALLDDPTSVPQALQAMLEEASTDTLASLKAITNDDERTAATFATCYLLCVKSEKGEYAFHLEKHLRGNLAAPSALRLPFECPPYLKRAIEWTCVLRSEGEPL